MLLSQSYRPLTNKYGVDISTWQCMCFIFIYLLFCTVYEPKVAHFNIK